MALLNEKRNRIPLVATLPVDGDDNGIRGQMRMAANASDGVIEVCTVSDQDVQSVLSVDTTASGTMDYTSVGIGDASEDITITHAVGGSAVPVVTVVGSAITVTGDDGVTTAAQIITAIEGSAAASALVTVVSNSGTTIEAASVANMAGGAGTKAAQTFNTDLVLTALSSGRAGNDITLTIVDVTGSNLVVTVSGKAITITGDTANVAHDTTAMVAAINNSTRANKLVVASGGSGQDIVAAGSAPLINGASLAVWLTVNAA